MAGIGDILKKIFTDDGEGINRLDWSNILLGLGGLYGASRIDNSDTLSRFFGTGGQRPVGYQGSIPKYTASRQSIPNPNQVPGAPGKPQRGAKGHRYFGPMQYTAAAQGGLMTLGPKPGQAPIKFGSPPMSAGFRKPPEVGIGPGQAAPVRPMGVGLGQAAPMRANGLMALPPRQSRSFYLGGPTDGMADQVPAHIEGREPAALSDGEFVVAADVVSDLGNGNSTAGAQELYSFMERVRKARHGTPKQGRQSNPRKFTPV